MDNTFHGFHTLKFFAGFNFDTKLRTDNKKQYFSIVVSIQKKPVSVQVAVLKISSKTL